MYAVSEIRFIQMDAHQNSDDVVGLGCLGNVRRDTPQSTFDRSSHTSTERQWTRPIPGCVGISLGLEGNGVPSSISARYWPSSSCLFVYFPDFNACKSYHDAMSQPNKIQAIESSQSSRVSRVIGRTTIRRLDAIERDRDREC